MACNEDIIRRNPFDFKLVDVVPNNSKKRGTMTEEQQDIWMTYIREDKTYAKYYVEKTKTACGVRFIPMTDDVYRSLKNILVRRKKVKMGTIVDRYSGLILHRLLHHLLHHLPENLCRFMEICVGNTLRTENGKNVKPVDITGFADL